MGTAKFPGMKVWKLENFSNLYVERCRMLMLITYNYGILNWNNSLFREVAKLVKEPQPAIVSLRESYSVAGDQDQNVAEHSNHSQDTLLPLERLEGIKLQEKLHTWSQCSYLITVWLWSFSTISVFCGIVQMGFGKESFYFVRTENAKSLGLSRSPTMWWQCTELFSTPSLSIDAGLWDCILTDVSFLALFQPIMSDFIFIFWLWLYKVEAHIYFF